MAETHLNPDGPVHPQQPSGPDLAEATEASEIHESTNRLDTWSAVDQSAADNAATEELRSAAQADADVLADRARRTIDIVNQNPSARFIGCQEAVKGALGIRPDKAHLMALATDGAETRMTDRNEGVPRTHSADGHWIRDENARVGAHYDNNPLAKLEDVPGYKVPRPWWRKALDRFR